MNQVRFHMEQGRMGKVIVGRLRPDTPFIYGIEQMCNDADISHAILQCAIGSLQSAYLRALGGGFR